nr:hypothetical protein [Raoultella ornithinolytica]
MAESRAVRSALGFKPDADDVSQSDLVEAINQIVAELCVIRTAHPQPLGPAMDAAIDAFNAEEMPETGMLNSYFILRESIRIKTPATDRIVAGIKADGVEEFLKGSKLPYQIATVLADYDNADDETLHHVIWSGQPPEPDGDVWHLEYVSRGNAIVREVLKQMREGAK